MQDRAALERLARSGVEPYRRVRAAGALLALAGGESVRSVARELGAHQDTVRRWRDRFLESGVAGVGQVAPGRGRKPQIAAATVAAIVGDTVAAVPDDGSVCWSTRSMAARHGVGKDTVARIWRARGLRPWRADVFKLSNDADFEAKLTDVVGLYLDPPERAVVFSFDEKTQVQALDRTQPSLPIKPGRARTMTHDYRRCGTVDLFAALNIATGEVLHQTRKTHTGRDVLAFFARIDDHTPRELDIHVILDNLSAHAEPVRRWLAHPKRADGTCTSPPPARRGSTSSRPGSPSSPARPSPTTASTPSPTSPRPSTHGPRTTTPTPSPSSGGRLIACRGSDH